MPPSPEGTHHHTTPHWLCSLFAPGKTCQLKACCPYRPAAEVGGAAGPHPLSQPGWGQHQQPQRHKHKQQQQQQRRHQRQIRQQQQPCSLEPWQQQLPCHEQQQKQQQLPPGYPNCPQERLQQLAQPKAASRHKYEQVGCCFCSCCCLSCFAALKSSTSSSSRTSGSLLFRCFHQTCSGV